MSKIWTLSGLSFAQILKRIWEQTNEDDVFGRAAQLSYYFLLALFPLLLFLLTLLGYFADAGSQIRSSLLRYLGTVMPWSALDLVKKTMDEISIGASGGKLSFGFLAALWAASNGMTAITDTLNVAYDVQEKRSWWKLRLVAITLTIILALMIIMALAILLMGGRLADYIAAVAGLGPIFVSVWKILQWVLVLAFVVLTFSLIYYFAPDVPQRKWYWVTPGSLAAVVLWLLVSFGFRIYLHFFNSYSVTYGSLGALIILMLWFYFTGVAILIGGEVNAEIACAANPFPRHKHSPRLQSGAVETPVSS